MIKKMMVPVFLLWETLYSWIFKIHIVENSPYKLLRVGIHPYRGQPLPLDDGTTVQPGEYVAELHISNITVYRGKVGGVTVASDMHLLPLFKEEMRNLARLIRQDKLDRRVKAIWGVTLFGPGVRRMGFSVRPLPPSKKSTRLKAWMSFLRWIFAPPTAKNPSKNSASRQPQEYWISINRFVQKYGH